MWQAWTNGLLGVWLAVAPFAGMDTPSAKLNNILVGAIIGTVAAFYQRGNTWQRAITMIAGAWMLASGFLDPFIQGTPYFVGNLVSAILVVGATVTLHAKQTIVQQD